MFDKTKTLAFGSDHAGFELKEFLKIRLAESGYSIRDFGTNSPDSVDYPDFAHPVASAVNDGLYEMAILICGTGNGVNIVANKYPEVRGALCWNQDIARMARLHNNANILILPGRYISHEEALEAALLFLQSDFEGGRHQLRIDKIPIH
jgi:ribose 5-phosphate isomerase B